MAGLSTKDLKARIHSMESTRQITKAMEMVAASKLRGAQNKAQRSRPYFEILYETITDLSSCRPDYASPFTAVREDGKTLAIVIAGDRGLAGGYNANITKMVWQEIKDIPSVVLPLGKKALEFFKSRTSLMSEAYGEAGSVTSGDCFTLAHLITEAFRKGEYRRVILGYTNFVSVIEQAPAVLELLPLAPSPKEEAGTKLHPILYEPDSETVYNAIIPEYLGGLIYGALCESVASEHAARRTAMDAASKNADEMIADLSLRFNRARQGAITQEITEIVAGAET